jgi:oligopeptide transport system substrate-binding protein
MLNSSKAGRHLLRPLGLALFLSWCFPVAGGASAAPLRRAVPEEIASIDPQEARTPHARLIARDLFEGLVTLDAERMPIPGAAARWDVLDDARTFVFHLRPEGKWSDGRPVAARNFVAAFQRLAARGTASSRMLLADVVNSDAVAAGHAPASALGVEAVDDLTFRIRLVRPQGSLIQLLADVALAPVPDGAAPDGTRPEGTPMLSNGPYRVASSAPGAALKLERNPFYHGSETLLVEEVHYIPLPRGASRAEAYRRGDVDTAPVTDQDLAWARENLPDELYGPDIPAGAYLMVASGDGPLARHAELRRALSFALDREALTNTLSPPGLRPLNVLIPGAIGGYESPPGPFEAISQPERQARAMDILANHRGTPPGTLRLCLGTPGPSRHQVLAVGLMWHLRLGLHVRTVAAAASGGGCDLRASTVHVDIGDPLVFVTMLAAEVPGGVERLAPVLAAARSEAEPARRQALLHDAEQAVLESHWIIPLWREVSDVLVKPRVRGWRADNPYLPTRFLSTLD